MKAVLAQKTENTMLLTAFLKAQVFVVRHLLT